MLIKNRIMSYDEDYIMRFFYTLAVSIVVFFPYISVGKELSIPSNVSEYTEKIIKIQKDTTFTGVTFGMFGGYYQILGLHDPEAITDFRKTKKIGSLYELEILEDDPYFSNVDGHLALITGTWKHVDYGKDGVQIELDPERPHQILSVVGSCELGEAHSKSALNVDMNLVDKVEEGTITGYIDIYPSNRMLVVDICTGENACARMGSIYDIVYNDYNIEKDSFEKLTLSDAYMNEYDVKFDPTLHTTTVNGTWVYYKDGSVELDLSKKYEYSIVLDNHSKCVEGRKKVFPHE